LNRDKKNENEVKNENKNINPKPDKEWTLLCNFKTLKLSLSWQLLFMGDEKMWEYLDQSWNSQN
jgi:hypothetical protein